MSEIKPFKKKVIQVVGESKQYTIENRLIKGGGNWLKTETSYSTKYTDLELNLEYICTDEFTPMSTWGTLSSIKAGIKRNPEAYNLPLITAKDINYFKYSESIYKAIKSKSRWTVFENVREMDISAAYITGAYKMNMINKDNFNKLLNGSKAARIKILGALATQKVVYYYQGGNLIDTIPVPPDPLNRNVWFNICKFIDEIINRAYILLDREGLFYYVDNIYFYDKPGLAELMEQHFKSYGLIIKTVPLTKLALFNSSRGAVVAVKRKGKNKINTFFVPNKKIIKYQINDL